MASTTTPTDRPTAVPGPIPSEPGVPLPPDSISYRLKRRVLGKPLHSEELEHQRLGKPTALAVFAVFRLRIGMIPVLLGAAAFGVAWRLATAGAW